MLAPWKKNYDKLRQHIKKQRHYFTDKGPYSQSCGFSSSVCGCDSWTLKEAEHWRTICTELWNWRRLLRDCKIKPVSLKGDQSWVFIGRTDAEAEATVLWPPDVKSWLIGKDPDPGKDWRQEEKGMTEDKMVGWHHRVDGHEFEHALGDGEGQGSLVCYSLWHWKELDTT